MNRIRLLAVVLAILYFFPNAQAQDYTRWGLPEGARARLGKGRIFEIAYSPDGTRLAVASAAGIWLYNPHTGAEIALLAGHTAGVSSVAFSPDGLTLASGCGGHTIRLWDAITGQSKATFTGHTDGVASIAFSPGGRTLASGSRDHTVLLWDMSPYITPSTPPNLTIDFDGNGTIGFADFLLFVAKFGVSEGDEGYDARFDLDGDGAIGFGDFLIFANDFGKEAS